VPRSRSSLISFSPIGFALIRTRCVFRQHYPRRVATLPLRRCSCPSHRIGQAHFTSRNDRRSSCSTTSASALVKTVFARSRIHPHAQRVLLGHFTKPNFIVNCVQSLQKFYAFFLLLLPGRARGCWTGSVRVHTWYTFFATALDRTSTSS